MASPPVNSTKEPVQSDLFSGRICAQTPPVASGGAAGLELAPLTGAVADVSLVVALALFVVGLATGGRRVVAERRFIDVVVLLSRTGMTPRAGAC